MAYFSERIHFTQDEDQHQYCLQREKCYFFCSVDLSSEGPLFSFPAVPAATGGDGNVADANDAAGPVRRVEAPGELRQVEQVRRHQFRPE